MLDLDFATTPEAMLCILTAWMHLNDHTITFHIIGDQLIAGGLIDEECDLLQSNAFDSLAYDYPDDPTIFISDVITYQLGSGESDSADMQEVSYLTEALTSHPEVFHAMLNEYADVLAHLEDVEIENPAYDAEDDDAEYDD